MIKKLLFVVMFLTFSLQIKAEINQSTIFVLGSLDKETKTRTLIELFLKIQIQIILSDNF